jgi:hypothetical protein
MAEMTAAMAAAHLDATHPEGTVFVFADRTLFDRGKKTRPAATGIKLCIRLE